MNFRHSLIRGGFICLFTVMFLVLLAFTVRATSVRGVFDNASLMSDAWFQVTLLDAYLGFLTIYIWVAWSEKTFLRRLIWFLLIMCFGNMAISAYVVLRILQLPQGAGFRELMTKTCPTSNSVRSAVSH